MLRRAGSSSRLSRDLKCLFCEYAIVYVLFPFYSLYSLLLLALMLADLSHQGFMKSCSKLDPRIIVTEEWMWLYLKGGNVYVSLYAFCLPRNETEPEINSLYEERTKLTTALLICIHKLLFWLLLWRALLP
jgi:hypothetical protein